IGRKILRFIDDENGVAPTRVGCQQKCIQRIEQLLGAGVFFREGDAKLVGDRLQQLVRIQLRIDDDGDVDMLRNLLEQTTTDGGLARPDLACEHDETAVIADSINQMPQGLAMLLAEIEIARVRRNGKWRFGETEMMVVHGRRQPCSVTRTSTMPAASRLLAVRSLGTMP